MATGPEATVVPYQRCVTAPTRTVLALAALLSLISSPGLATAGYDIAHIVERTCQPGGSLIVGDEWKERQDRDRLITEPGEVIACPPEGPRNSFQIAAGPQQIGRESHLCTYFSLLNGDGADTCAVSNSSDVAASTVTPLIAIRAERRGRLQLLGNAGDEVAAVTREPPKATPRDVTLIPIRGPRAVGLGAARAFSYFFLTVDRRTLCAEERPQVLGRDSSGRRNTETVPISTQLLDAADRVPYARPLKTLCGSRGPSEPIEAGWLTRLDTLLRSLLTSLI